MSHEIQVYKFGGSSIGTIQNIRNVINIIKNVTQPTVVVVSAMGGITDRLLNAAHQAAKGNGEEYVLTCNHMLQRYSQAVDELVINSSELKLLKEYIDASVNEFETICKSLKVLKEHTPRILDAIVARGERFSAKLFCAALNDLDANASFIDGAELISLSRQYKQLSPQMSICEQQVQNRLVPLLQKSRIVMVPGFIGKGPDGEVRTLGRGGSDYTATIIANCLNAERVVLYKEVDGLLTADPKYVKEARVVPTLHFREATELAYYGAKILHPRTIIPLIEKQIPLTIKSSFSPNYPGTLISNSIDEDKYPVKALTAMTGQALVSVEGKGMIGVPGIAARTFTAMAQADISISFISQSSSEASICFVVPKSQAQKAVLTLEETFQWELKHKLIDNLKAKENLAIVAVVGLGMEGTPGIASRTFSSLSQLAINIIAIAQGSSELNISFAIEESHVKSTLNALHKEYRLDKLQALPYRNGKMVDLCLFGFGQIGQTLTKQMMQQDSYFRDTLQFKNNTIAVADRSGMWINKNGLSQEDLISCLELKSQKTSLWNEAKNSVLAYAQQASFKQLFDLPLHRGIFVDMTADDTASTVINAIEHNFHIVLANKKPLAVKQEVYDQIMDLSKSKGLKLRYEATVGAGLPILDTLEKLSAAGDAVISIQGCLSGTLGYILTELEDGLSFSQAVKKAYDNGFTEPDPREDLSGMDVARKALILARNLGYRINLEDLDVEPLYNKEFSHENPEVFLKNIEKQDEEMRQKFAHARKDKRSLRYVASINDGKIDVGLVALDENAPLGRLRGTNNQVTIKSTRYNENPLIVTGPGAGAEVTAAGVLNDIIAIALLED